MKVIGWLSERERLPESSGKSVKVIGGLSERVELMPAGESVKVIGLEGRDVAGTRFNLRQNY